MKEETKIIEYAVCSPYRKWDERNGTRPGPGSAHLTSRIWSRSLAGGGGPSARVTHPGVISRVRIVVHSGSQPAGCPSRPPGAGEPAGTRAETALTFLSSYTCPTHKILRCGHVRDDNRGLATASCPSVRLLLALLQRTSQFLRSSNLIPRQYGGLRCVCPSI